MACQTRLQKENGKYLWFTLLGLGFRPENHLLFYVTETTAKHMNLGPNMFDKPNKDAFYIVIHFLLEKLNPTRFHQTYKYCLPLGSNKQDAAFRKETCFWLREIMDETGYPGSKVLMSLLLSPGGPKFTSLMVRLATHVMLQEMKTFSIDGSWMPDAVAKPASSLDMAVKRLNLIKKRFLKEVIHQHCFLQEEQKRAQSVVNSLRDLTAESKKYDELLKKHVGDCVREEESSADKPATVRSLWSSVDGMLSTTEQNRKVLESVLEGEADRYALDGTGRRLKVPRSLLERMERPSQQLRSGKVYEGGQLKPLCALELFAHALRLLKDEFGEPPLSPARFGPLQLQDRGRRLLRHLQELRLLGLKISMEEIPEVKSAISELEAQSDKKWPDAPFVSLLDDDPALGFLSPMARWSSEPTFDSSDASGVFSQFPAKLPEKSSERHLAEGESDTSSDLKGRGAAAEERPRGDAAAESSPADSSLDWLLRVSPPPRQKTPSAPPQATVRATPTRTKKPILDMECDNLADQFADAVATASPTTGRLAGLELEGILSVLHGDPFNTRKQLPRTPESLILDVKSSWKKALEEDNTEKCDDSVTGCLTPVGDARRPGSSHDAFSTPGTPKSERRSFWGTVCSVTPFSLAHETLPELPSCDTLLSFDEEDEPIAVPRLEAGESALNVSHVRQPRDGGSPDCFLLARNISALGRERPSPPAVFSLDLDALGTLTPPLKTQQDCLPTLISFSPMDDKAH
ncbi:HAUS augmin-like complex subunit 6 isoform X2 [Phyllopteryx taeniolatus]|uniref:HAUS augmin-like complex subunit 6 isoform X2 n=1 Tax=Phyllopteryx taeniolatus TaxID=161469 RepID=UPI002AD47AEE|nr:HAUS augmin-like complex subunit 6 isoform X2 [Phyllopteryx taeniolatus]